MDDQKLFDAPDDDADRSSSRRGLLKLAAGAAAGAGVAVVASKASPAAAADTEGVLSGNVNEATLSTEFVYGSDANSTPSTSTTEIVNVDASAAPDDRAALRATAGTTANAIVAVADEGAAISAESAAGIGVVATGAAAALQLVAAAGVEPPVERTTSAEVGSIVFDENQDLWICVEAGTPGTWRKLSGPATAGAFHPIVPIRVYDSRLGAYSPGGGTPMQRLTERVISVADSHNAAGTVIAADAVPPGATAVALNVTVASPTGPNYLSVAPADATEVYASTINWPGGFDAANGTIVKVDADRQVKVICGDQAGGTHVVLDVTGYYT